MSSRLRSVLCLLAATMPCVGLPARAQGQTPVSSSLFRSSAVYALHGEAGETTASLPLGVESEGLALSSTVALAFKVKGETGTESVRFDLESGPGTPVIPLGNVFEYSPTGPGTDWTQIVIPLGSPPTAGGGHVVALRVSYEDGARGTVSIKDILAIPRSTDSAGWNSLAIALPEYGLTSPQDISQVVLEHLAGDGTRISSIQPRGPQGAGAAVATPVVKSYVPRFSDGYYRVAGFDHWNSDEKTNQYGIFQRTPSKVDAELVPVVRPHAGGKALRLQYVREKDGFCGLWVRFLPPASSAERLYLDASPFRFLSFWVRSDRGDEDATIQLADQQWDLKDDSLPLGRLSQFMTGGITREWKQVLIPLDPTRFPRLDFTRLATLSVNMSRPGAGTLYLDDITLKTAAEVEVPPTPPIELGTAQPLRRATWIWDLSKVAATEDERNTLFQFAHDHSLNVFFVQIACEEEQSTSEPGCRLSSEEQFRQFNREARAHGIEVHALDGYSRYPLPPWQPKVLAQVRAVLDYNERVTPDERFAGIHHDNEAYLLPVFAGRHGDELLTYFLDLTFACQKLVKQAPHQITYGVDIPFWYDTIEVEWHGARKTVSEHVIDTVDEVGVMAYRTTASGPGGVVALAEKEVDYAGKQGKKVFVALETTPLPDQVTYTFKQEPNDAPSSVRGEKPLAYLLVEQWNGAAVFYWRELKPDDQPDVDATLRDALKPSGEGHQVFLSLQKAVTPGSFLSFAAQRMADLNATVEQVQEEFAGAKGFAGVAVHHYESYRELASR